MALLRSLTKLLAGEAGRAPDTVKVEEEQARRLQRFDARLAEVHAQRASGAPPPSDETIAPWRPNDTPRFHDGAILPPDWRSALASGRQRPILFRQLYPPPITPGRSFYGGVPIGPVGMEWPRDSRSGRPLSFVLQVDAAILAEQDATGLLPSTGALYFFSNLGWGDEMTFRFVHTEDDGRDWAPLPVPDDLPPAFGKEAAHLSPLCSAHVAPERQDPPRLLPRWPFTPVGIDYPEIPQDDGEDGAKLFWAEIPEVKEAVLRAQDPSATLCESESSSREPFARPFPRFPHDWAAVRVVAAAALDRMTHISAGNWRRFIPDADESTREAVAERWRYEALALYHEALDHPVSAAVPQHRADELWQRIERLEPVFWPSFGRVADNAVNLSLGLGSDSVDDIPPDRIAVLVNWHVLGTVRMREQYAHEFRAERGLDLPHREVDQLYAEAKAAGALEHIRDVWAPTPNRMFGPPSYVQGYVEEFVDEWLLLLELSSSEAIGLPMGDGVLQFLIRPEDLTARRFDGVRAITTGY